jgi:hypothetical protein
MSSSCVTPASSLIRLAYVSHSPFINPLSGYSLDLNAYLYTV